MPPCKIEANASPIYLKLVARLRKRFRKIDEDLGKLFDRVAKEHTASSAPIPRLDPKYAGAIRKYYCQNSDRRVGSSWGYRVIGFYAKDAQKMYPIFIYDHPDKVDVTPQEIDSAMVALRDALKAPGDASEL